MPSVSPEPSDFSQALERLDENLWVATRPLPLWIGDVGTRMTVVRVDGGLVLHSPVPLDAATRQALDRLGPVRQVVGPNKVHHLFLGEYARAYPEAELCGALGLAEKRRDLRFAHRMDASWRPPWGPALRHLACEGAPALNEVVFHHPASRTLVLRDLVFHVARGSRNRARLFHALVGATGRFGPHRLVRALLRDRAAFRRSLDPLLGWDFERVVMAHGGVVEKDGRARLEEAFAFVLRT